MQHIVKKQIIDLTLNRKMDAFAIQHLVSERYWQEIVPVLQKALDSMSTEEEILHVDKLEIDLGMVSLRDIENGRWNAEVYNKISERLILLNASPSTEKKVRKQSGALSIAEQWIFYMKHGYLPWNILETAEEWYKNVLKAFAGNSVAIEKLRSLIRLNPVAASRIVFQHSSGFLKALMETLTAEKQDKLPKFLDEMAQVILFLNGLNESDRFLKKEWMKKLWLHAFQFSVLEKDKLNSLKLIVHLLKENVQSSELVKDLPHKFLYANRLTAPILKQIKRDEYKLEAPPLKEFDLTQKISIENKSHLEEGIYVLHAGVVLLHPFLNIFFKGLGLIKENVFVNESTHQKALFLLHYMATGMTMAKEHELIIEKTLCAWPLEKPVGLSVPIKADDLKEADILLTEIIQQWKILKKTSFAGLREGFLQRNGKLYMKNDNLRLQVEASAIDVLLDQLPWNLSLIKLPWMNDILRIEWR